MREMLEAKKALRLADREEEDAFGENPLADDEDDLGEEEDEFEQPKP